MSVGQYHWIRDSEKLGTTAEVWQDTWKMWKPSDPHLDVSLSLTHMQTGKRRLLAVLFYEITRREFCKKNRQQSAVPRLHMCQGQRHIQMWVTRFPHFSGILPNFGSSSEFFRIPNSVILSYWHTYFVLISTWHSFSTLDNFKWINHYVLFNTIRFTERKYKNSSCLHPHMEIRIAP